MSLEGFFVGGIWPSLYTGVTPARHGIHSLVQLKPGTYEFSRCYPGEFSKREPFWNVLSRAGRHVAILDIPLSGISQGINGIQSVEWGSHDANYGFCAWPPEFEAEVKGRFGLHPLTQSCNAYGRTPQEFVTFRDLLLQGVKKKAELTKYYLSRGGWDFFAQVFTESHCVGYQCWHLHDLQHPGYDPEVVAVTGNPIRDVYVAIDAAMGEVLAQVGDDAVVVVLAGHRMAHKCGAQFLLPLILTRLGVAVLPSAKSAPGTVDRLDTVLAWGWHRTPPLIRKKLNTVRNRLRNWIDSQQVKLPPSVSTLDAAHSQCFLTDNGFPVSGLRFNLEGREPHGLIRPGPALEAFCAQLERDLLDLVDVDGKPVAELLNARVEG